MFMTLYMTLPRTGNAGCLTALHLSALMERLGNLNNETERMKFI
jgi:hypothetical protein